MSPQIQLARAAVLIVAVGQAVSGAFALADLPAAAQVRTISGADLCRTVPDAAGPPPVSAAPEICRLALEHPPAVLLALLVLAAVMGVLYVKIPRHPTATLFSALLLTVGETAAWLSIFGWSLATAIPRAILAVLLLRGAVASASTS